MTIDCRNHRLRYLVWQQPGDLCCRTLRIAVLTTGEGLVASTQIGSGTECPIPRPGQNHSADLIVVVTPVHGVRQFAGHDRSPSVHVFGAVQGDSRDPRLDLEENL